MKKARTSGFTIIEVMIVLAVTGMLLLAATSVISGRTNTEEFDQSTRALQQQIQDTINEVASGSYPDSSNYSCNQSGPASITLTNSPSTQGENLDCVFLGKVIQFGIPQNGLQTGFETYSIAGLKENAGQQITSLSASDPTLIAPSTSNPLIPDDGVLNQIEYGLHTYCHGGVGNCGTNGDSSMNFVNSGGTSKNINSFAIIYSFAQYNANGQIQNGSQQLNLVPITGTSLNSPAASASNSTANTLSTDLDGATTASPGDVVNICLQSATTSQYALISIGNNGSQLDVTLSIMNTNNGTTCP